MKESCHINLPVLAFTSLPRCNHIWGIWGVTGEHTWPLSNLLSGGVWSKVTTPGSSAADPCLVHLRQPQPWLELTKGKMWRRASRMSRNACLFLSCVLFDILFCSLEEASTAEEENRGVTRTKWRSLGKKIFTSEFDGLKTKQNKSVFPY